MAKKARVYDGTAWQELASAQTDLTAYSTTAQMNTAITAASGLTLINTTSFSAVASQSINDVFSATYDNYVLIMDFSSSANVSINFRLRASGSDLSTTDYNYHTQTLATNSTTYSAIAGGAETSFKITTSDGTDSLKSVDVTLLRPFLTQQTSLIGTHNYSGISGAPPYKGGTVHGSFSLTTSATGFTIFPVSGTITGKIRVYGVKN